MSINYTTDVAPLEADGRTDEQIASMINAKTSRFPAKQQTMLELVQRLIEVGNAQAQAMVDTVVSNLATASQQSKVMESTYLRLMNGGTIDIGAPAMRVAVVSLGGQAIVDAYPLAIPMATAEAVASARSEHAASQSRDELLAWIQRFTAAANIAAQADGATRESVWTAAVAESEAEVEGGE